MLHTISSSFRRFCALVVASVAFIAHAQTALPSAQVGQAYSFQVSTTPASPAGTVYSATGLPTGISINSSSGLISGIPTAAGTSTGTISLTTSGVTNSFTVSIIVNAAAGTPAISSATTASGTVGQAFGYTVSATNSPTSFNVGALPTGLSFTSPTISGTPTKAGTYSVALSANNATGTGATTTLTVTIAPPGPVPAVSSATTATAAPNAAFSYQITATNSPTSYSATGLPFGLSVNASTGLISGTPTVQGVYTVALAASNANGTGTATNLSLTVGSLSAITSAGSATLTVNQAGTFQLTASNSPVSFNVTGLPPGLSVNTTTGAISGTPTATGTYTVTVSANNATGVGQNSTLTLTVATATSSGGGGGGGGGIGGGGTTTAPVFTQQPTGSSVTDGNTVTFTAGVAGTGPFTYQWRKDGTAIAGATGASLTLTAHAADAGTYTLAATNAAGTTVSSGATLVVISINTPPVVTTAPISQTAGAGGTVTLTVAGSGPGLTYQWKKDGVAIAGATGATLTLNKVQAADTGHYTVTLTNSAGSVTSSDTVVAVMPTNAQVINLSTRGMVGTGEKVLIAGFVVTGNDPKPVLVRAIGPGLAQFGLGGLVADPVLEIRNNAQVLVATNDNWSTATNAAAVVTTSARLSAFPLAANSNDAAILTTLPPGLYTATVRGAGNTTGLGMVEIYDASDAISTARLINVSSRADVGTGGNVLIAGFVVTGPDPKKVLIRGVGPALGAFGVTTALTDPRIELHQGTTIVAQNDDWGTNTNALDIAAAAKATGAFDYAAGSKDAALLLTLQPGSYSVHVFGANGSTGAGMVEVYEVP